MPSTRVVARFGLHPVEVISAEAFGKLTTDPDVGTDGDGAPNRNGDGRADCVCCTAAAFRRRGRGIAGGERYRHERL
ncbi:hypothetical protein [Escherichia coli]|uniref:hypothetical protein n=1 Tax=Escherichia coli TaxID=562 RepID=UPI00388F3C52